MNEFRLLTIFFLCLLLVACDSKIDKEPANLKQERKQEQSIIEDKVDIKIVASEKKLPSNFHKIAEKKGFPNFHPLVSKVDTQAKYEEVWSLYNLKEQIRKVDFEVSDIYFIGVQESGSCPYEVEEMNIENQVINIHFAEPKGRCTLDATPRTFVIEVEKGSSSGVKNIVIGQTIVETTVTINDLKLE